jgi:hypothetical protein
MRQATFDKYVRPFADAERLRESYDASRAYKRAGETASLLDLSGDGVPTRTAQRPMTTEALLHESQLDEAEFTRMRSAEDAGSVELVDLGDDVPRPMREATFGGDAYGTDKVYYEDDDTLAELQDLFTVLPVTLPNGSPNLANEIVKAMIADVQHGHPLSPVQIGKFLELRSTHADAIAKLRARSGKGGQDYMDVPNPATARLVESARATGLIDLRNEVRS